MAWTEQRISSSPTSPLHRNTGPKTTYKCFFSALEGSVAILYFTGFQDYFLASLELQSTSFSLESFIQ